MKNLSEAIVDRLCFYIGKNNISLYKLSLDSGVSSSTLKSIMQRKTKDIKLKTLIMLCNGLNITVSEFFDDESFLFENLNLY